ncbi:MAG: 50S ribosomal protein L10 [Candidatus Omnitrophota bacterium]|nr:50S ribosomal protein L10 [Candidatus Omnitrophota bacterium]
MDAKKGYGKLCKDRMIGEILNDIKERPNFFITNFMGSSVSDLESVRKSLRPTKGTFFVVKNSMINVVLDQLKLEEAKSMIDGGVGISLSGDDIIATSKVLVNFSKTHEKFKIKGAVIDGKLVAVDKVKEMASLPSKEVLLAQVVGGMKAPITGFVSVLGGIIRKFVYAVDAVKVSKEKAPQAQPTQ